MRKSKQFAILWAIALLTLGSSSVWAQNYQRYSAYPTYTGNSISSGNSLKSGAYAAYPTGSRTNFNPDAYARKEATRIRAQERIENSTRYMPLERKSSYFNSDSGFPAYLPLK